MKEKIYRVIKKSIKNPIIVTIIFVIIVGLIVFSIENRYGIDPNIIALSLTVLFSVTGYFLIHFLEIKRKEREERLKQYKELASKIRVFVKKMDDKSKLGEEFDEIYYTSWMIVSSNVYKKLIDYLDSYVEWEKGGKTEKLLSQLQKNFKELMDIMRKEFINDEEVEFKDYDIRWNKKVNE